jgi:hypothetical protein
MLAEARAAVHTADADHAERILELPLILPNLREGAALLARLWVDYRALIVGRAAAEAESLPYAYDFGMNEDQSVITTAES